MTILEEAKDVVDGDRQKDYGHPSVNHANTLGLIKAYLRAKYGDTIHVDRLTIEDICMINIQQKIARNCNKPKRDNLVDLCGWARNIEMCFDEYQEGPSL